MRAPPVPVGLCWLHAPVVRGAHPPNPAPRPWRLPSGVCLPSLAAYAKHMRLIGDDKELLAVKQRLVTEEKQLEQLLATNQALEKDVERFKQLQANKKRLDLYRGKLLWVEADYFEQLANDAKAEHAALKDEVKAIKDRLTKAAQAAAPLEQAKVAMAGKLKDVNKKMLEADRERQAASTPKVELEQETEKLLQELGQLEKRREAKEKKVKDAKDALTENAKKMEKARAELAATEDGDPEEKRATLVKDKAEKDAAHRKATDEQREHASQGASLRRTHDEAARALEAVNNRQIAKMRTVAYNCRESAELAKWVEDQAEGDFRDQVVGPLMVHIDVPDKSHQRLVEECIGPKFGFGFVATTTAARQALSRKVASQPQWRVNIYMNASGNKYVPMKRPASAELKKFGATMWLDEAITLPAAHRDVVLGALKDLSSIDTYLLATPKTMGQIESLQAFLAEKGMNSVTVLTPDRVYRVTRSRYGDKRLNATTSQPKPVKGLYSNSVDEAETARLVEAKQQSGQALDAYAEEEARLDERVKLAADARNAAQQALQLFNTGRQFLVQCESRQTTLQQRVDVAQKELDAFDVGQRHADLTSKVNDAMGREVELNARICKATASMLALRSEESALKLAVAAATHQLSEAKEAKEALEKEYDDKAHERDAAKAKAKSAVDDFVAKATQAKKAAPQLEKLGEGGSRSAEGQRLWDSMPTDLEELETEITNLEEEINASDDDGGETLRKYEERLKDIEAAKTKVGDTQGEVADKQSALDALTDEWKPELHRMIGVVNDNFATYFKRFRCCGEVSLADGRKLNPSTGQPEGSDDFSQYKILIKVQWRKTEELHVLGEGGRDSGGERSVATMVYLISLQNINPAPFRVVDEINQAMDSTNERNVFECITHACREGGKQYFLLTPKLLPDLEYGEETVLQIVFNGPYTAKREEFSLSMFT